MYWCVIFCHVSACYGLETLGNKKDLGIRRSHILHISSCWAGNGFKPTFKGILSLNAFQRYPSLLVLCSSGITASAGILFSVLVRPKLRRSPYLQSNTGWYFCFRFCFNSSALTQTVTWGLQAAGCLPSSLAKGTPGFSGKAFLLYSLASFHVSNWVNSEGFDLQRGESTQLCSQGDFWAWQDKTIFSFCMSSLDLLFASARLLAPAASFYYFNNNHLANRDLSLQAEGRINPNWYCRWKFA